MIAYVVEIVYCHDGSTPEVVYTDKEAAEQHVETWNLTYFEKNVQYARFYERELKDKFTGL